MTAGVAVFVGLGVLAAVLLGLGVGFDRGAYVILSAIIAFGLLTIAVARKAQTGAVRPDKCPHCGGVISPNAPYCKHCGENL